MIEEVVRGQPIRLNLQLSDGEESLPKIVLAFLRDGYGSLLPDYSDGVSLSHVGQGLFKNKSILMPQSVSEITSQYVVYNPDGMTIDTEYIHSYDKFVPIDESESGSSSSGSADEMIAVLVEDNSTEIEVVDIKDAETVAEQDTIEAFLDVDEEDIIVTIKDEEEA